MSFRERSTVIRDSLTNQRLLQGSTAPSMYSLFWFHTRHSHHCYSAYSIAACVYNDVIADSMMSYLIIAADSMMSY